MPGHFVLQVLLRRAVAFLAGVGVYFFAFKSFLRKIDIVLRGLFAGCFVNALRAVAFVGECIVLRCLLIFLLHGLPFFVVRKNGRNPNVPFSFRLFLPAVLPVAIDHALAFAAETRRVGLVLYFFIALVSCILLRAAVARLLLGGAVGLFCVFIFVLHTI